jgi:hypothetical protein
MQSGRKRYPANLHAALLKAELQAFIAQTDDHARARDAILDELGVVDRRRIYKLLFLPGILFEWCTTTTEWQDQAHQAAVTEQRRIHSYNNFTQGRSFVPNAQKKQCQEHTDTLVEFFTLAYPPEPVVQTWRKTLGISHELTLDTQIQHIWTIIGCELVDRLAPFCPYTYVKDAPQAPPYDAFVKAARLMYYAQPTLWKDDVERLRNRYTEAQWQQRPCESHPR